MSVAPTGAGEPDGGLRLIHRRQVPDPNFPGEGPYHSYEWVLEVPVVEEGR